MRCASGGEKIEGAPIWRDDEAYCSEECAEIEAMDDDFEDEGEECEEDDEDEKEDI